MALRAWEGGDWQEYCLSLLRLRYGDHNLQEVPDRDGGDLGMEAFTYDGCAFQCYAAEEPVTTKDLYEKQRDKLTADTNKLKLYAADIWKMLGDTVIDKYVFMVPRYESTDLISHARIVEERVRDWALPFIADDFKIVIVNDDYYSRERAQLSEIPEQLIALEPADPAHVTEWEEGNDGLLQTLREKVEALGVVGAALDSYVTSIVEQYVSGENALAELREKFPEHWRTATRIKSQIEGRLAVEHPPGSETHPSLVPRIVDAMVLEIRADAPIVRPALAKQLAWSAVGDWLMRCPLETRSSS